MAGRARKAKGENKEEVIAVGKGYLIVPKDEAGQLKTKLVGAFGKKVLEEFEKLPTDEKREWASAGLGGAMGVVAIGGPPGIVIGAGIGLLLYHLRRGKIKLSNPQINVIQKVQEAMKGAKKVIASDEAKLLVRTISELQEIWPKK